jgi:hypothetical protein
MNEGVGLCVGLLHVILTLIDLYPVKNTRLGKQQLMFTQSCRATALEYEMRMLNQLQSIAIMSFIAKRYDFLQF